MAKHVIVSSHAKMRAAERMNVSRRNDVHHFFRMALTSGKSPHDFNGKFKNYLLKKLKNNPYKAIKIYGDFMYIHKGKNLITMYPVPSRFLPITDYLNSKQELEIVPELELRRYLHSSDFKFYTKKENNKHIAVLIVKEQLVAAREKKEEKDAKLACVKQYLKEVKGE